MFMFIVPRHPGWLQKLFLVHNNRFLWDICFELLLNLNCQVPVDPFSPLRRHESSLLGNSSPHISTRLFALITVNLLNAAGDIGFCGIAIVQPARTVAERPLQFAHMCVSLYKGPNTQVWLLLGQVASEYHDGRLVLSLDRHHDLKIVDNHCHSFKFQRSCPLPVNSFLSIESFMIGRLDIYSLANESARTVGAICVIFIFISRTTLMCFR